MKQTKSILIHSNYCPFNPQGGIELSVSCLIDSLGLLHHSKLTIFYGSHVNSVSLIDNIIAIKRKIIATFFGASLLDFGNISFYRSARSRDLVVYQEPYPTLWLGVLLIRLLSKTKVIVVIHAIPDIAPPLKSLYCLIRDFIFRGSVYVTTNPSIQYSLPHHARTSSKVIPLCLPKSNTLLSLPKVPSGLVNINSLNNRFFLFVGRISSYKGIAHILYAARSLPDIQFVIAGKGPQISIVDEYISTHSLTNIVFLNYFLSEEEKQYLIRKSYCLLFPSTSRNEAFGLIQLEAMRSGTAILNTFLNNGVNYVAPHMVSAYSITPNSPDKLVSAITFLNSRAEIVQFLAHNGTQRYRFMFDHESYTGEWISLITAILDRSYS